MSRSCRLEGEYPRKFIDSLTFILPLDILSVHHRMGRKGRRSRKGTTSIKGAMMMLVEEETPANPGTRTGMTGMRETSDTTRMFQTIDQPGVLIIEEVLLGNDKRSLHRISNQPSEALGGSPGIVECLVDLEAKKDLE